VSSTGNDNQIPESKKSTVRCSRCKNFGHTIRSRMCPLGPLGISIDVLSSDNQSREIQDKALQGVRNDPSSKSGAISGRRCSKCRNTGHNARSQVCPLNISAASQEAHSQREERVEAGSRVYIYINIYIYMYE
jgi:hypothetical protein